MWVLEAVGRLRNVGITHKELTSDVYRSAKNSEKTIDTDFMATVKNPKLVEYRYIDIGDGED